MARKQTSGGWPHAMPPILTENGCAPAALKPGCFGSRSGLRLLLTVVGCPTISVDGHPASALMYGPKALGATAGWVG